MNEQEVVNLFEPCLRDTAELAIKKMGLQVFLAKLQQGIDAGLYAKDKDGFLTVTSKMDLVTGALIGIEKKDLQGYMRIGGKNLK